MFRFLDRFEMGRLKFFELVCFAELIYLSSSKLFYFLPEWWNTISFICMIFAMFLLREGIIRRLKNAGLSNLWLIIFYLSLVCYYMPRSVRDFSNEVLWHRDLGGLFEWFVGLVLDLNSKFPDNIRFLKFPEIVMDIFGWSSALGVALIVYLCFVPSKKSSPERDS